MNVAKVVARLNRRKMKQLLGFLLILAGVFVGIWLGIYVMFIGGIVNIINAIKETPTNAPGIAFGILRVILSGFVGWFSGAIITAFGIALVER
jgi:hypothetical protein